MRRFAVVLALAVVLGATTSAPAQVLSTLPPNNGSGGVFFELTPSTTNLFMTGFATYFSGAVGLSVNVEVYTRPGNYAGFTASSAGWTLLETVTGTAAGTTTLSSVINLTNPISLTAGNTTSVYIHAITAGGGIRYQGTGTTSTGTFMNADLTLFSDTSRTGAVAFAGTQFTPRAFSGDIHYTAVPEPASLITFGLVGGVGIAVRRFRRAKA